MPTTPNPPRKQVPTPDNERAINEIVKDLIDALRERTIAMNYGEFIVKINFTNGKIVQHRLMAEKIVKHDS